MAKKSFKEGLNSLLQRTKKEPVATVVSKKKKDLTASRIGASAISSSKKNSKTEKKIDAKEKPIVTLTTKQDVKIKEKSKEAPQSANMLQNTTIIELGTNLTIDLVDDIKKKLINDSKGYKSIKITGSEIENIDLSVIQLLYSFRNDINKAKKELSFDIHLNNEMKNLLKNAGMFDEVLFN